MLRYEELPLEELKEIGYPRKKLLNLGSNLERLLLFKRTDVLPLSITSQTTGEIKDYKGRISVDEDNKTLNIHLIQPEFHKPFGMTDQQYEHLKSGNVLKRKITDEQGNPQTYLFQKDKETNELLKVKLEDINYALSADNLDDIQDGNPVLIGNTMIKIDLSHPEGFVVATTQELSKRQPLSANRNNGNEASLFR